MEYAQLNEAMNAAVQVATSGNVAWADTHFCPAAKLTPAEATRFRVVPLSTTEAPTINSITQTVVRDGCELVNGQWQYKWRVDSLGTVQVTANFQAAKSAALVKIDTETDKVYGDVVGNKGEEYRSAEADAKAFIAASYTGSVGGGVTSWATAKGWSTTQAADDIMAQATAWRGAQAAIRSNRLSKKESVKAALDLASLNTVIAQWSGFLNAIRTQLGV